MPDLSPRLGLPYLKPAQAQKHVTHNEAIERLDLLVQLIFASVDASDPPASPAEGEIHTVGAAPTGAWAGAARGTIAGFQGGGWVFVAPKRGWRGWDRTAGLALVHDGSAWIVESAAQTLPDSLPRLGVNAAASDTDRLSVAAEAVLFSHAGGSHRLKVNRAAATDTASLLFQSGFSGRAEIGLAGGDALSLKVSADGTAWTEALRLDPASGRASGSAVQSGARDAAAGRLLSVGAFGLGGGDNLVTDLTQALAPGHYAFAEDSAVGSPGTGAFQCTLEVRRAGAAGGMTFRAARIGTGPGTMRAWHGSRSGSVGAITWTDTMLAATLVGAVSQSGGIPTGAVVQSGANGNGRFVRWADGTQICETPSFVTASGGAAIWTFPAAFAFADVAVLGTSRFTGGPRIIACNPLSATTAEIHSWDQNGSSAVAPQAALSARGRWF